MRTRTRTAVAAAAIALVVSACGGGDDDTSEPAEPGTEPTVAAADTGFDESALPDDFPRNLIPPSYETGSYLVLSGVPTVAFESATPVDESIAHYTDLLGEPTLAVEGEQGERNVQWQDSPWVVSVVGSPDESLIGMTKLEG